MAKKKAAGSLAGVDIEVKAQPGKQTLAMDLMPEVMIYGGAAGCVSAETEYLTKMVGGRLVNIRERIFTNTILRISV